MMVRSQIAMEFIIMLGFATLVCISFIALLNMLIVQKNDEDTDRMFQELGESIQQEILLAAVAQNGYIREFEIPPADMEYLYEKYDYSVELNQTYVILSTEGQNYYYNIPNTTGNLSKGLNTIKNIGGKAYVNP